jgi:hypothetical protein
MSVRYRALSKPSYLLSCALCMRRNLRVIFSLLSFFLSFFLSPSTDCDAFDQVRPCRMLHAPTVRYTGRQKYIRVCQPGDPENSKGKLGKNAILYGLCRKLLQVTFLECACLGEFALERELLFTRIFRFGNALILAHH